MFLAVTPRPKRDQDLEIWRGSMRGSEWLNYRSMLVHDDDNICKKGATTICAVNEILTKIWVNSEISVPNQA